MQKLFTHITEVQKLTLTKDDILIVKFDYEKMPPSKRQQCAENIMETFKKTDPNMRIWIVPSTADFAIIHESEVLVKSKE